LPKPYFIMNKSQTQRCKADWALRELIAPGYIKKHPTGCETKYELDERGFETAGRSEIRERLAKACMPFIFLLYLLGDSEFHRE